MIRYPQVSGEGRGKESHLTERVTIQEEESQARKTVDFVESRVAEREEEAVLARRVSQRQIQERIS